MTSLRVKAAHALSELGNEGALSLMKDYLHAMSAEYRVMAVLPEEERWTCFHCGKTFTEEKKARRHFGDYVEQLKEAKRAARLEEKLACADVATSLAIVHLDLQSKMQSIGNHGMAEMQKIRAEEAADIAEAISSRGDDD